MGAWYGRDGEPLGDDYSQIEKLLSDPNYKLVGRTPVPGKGLVSTVWLGIDHRFGAAGPPLIFETLVFDCEPELIDRYATLEEAEAGHLAMIDKVRAL